MKPHFPGRRWRAAWPFLVVGMAAGSCVAASRADDGKSAEAPVRAAMMDFTSDDGLLRSAEGGAQCAALAQGILAAQEPGVTWIERSQLGLAADELHLSVAGFTGADGALHIGCWLKADVAILGRFSRNEKNDAGHTLRLEIVDLAHADTLATRALPVPGDRREAITPDPALTAAVVSALRGELAEARSRLAASAGRRIIAPLFFQNADPSPRLDSFGSDLRAALSRAAAGAPDVRVLLFPQAEAARGESDLAVRGLTADDAGSWRRVADLYVWGTYRELPAADLAFAQTPVEVELTLWDGANPARQLKETTAVAELPTLARRLADRCLDAARQAAPPRSAAEAEGTHEAVARELRMQGERLEAKVDGHGAQRAAFLATLEGKSNSRQARTLLAAACFFAPADREAQLARLRARWEGFPVPVAPRTLLGLWRFGNDLADFSARFGGNEELARNRLETTARLLDVLHDDDPQNRSADNDPGLPLDATAANVKAWHAAMDGRFASEAEAYAKVGTLPPTEHWRTLAACSRWLRAAFQRLEDPAAGMRVADALMPLYKPAYQRTPGRRIR